MFDVSTQHLFDVFPVLSESDLPVTDGSESSGEDGFRTVLGRHRTGSQKVATVESSKGASLGVFLLRLQRISCALPDGRSHVAFVAVTRPFVGNPPSHL